MIKNFILFVAIIFLSISCVENYPVNKITVIKNESFFVNKGFSLVYTDELLENKLVGKKIDERSLVIFQKNLKKNTSVKITNLLNGKSIIAKVGKNANYPIFFNSVISKRINDELELNSSEPYIEIKEIKLNSTFVAKKSKTFDEEKKVASKAPVDSIKIKDLSNSKKPKKKIIKKVFSYSIKIADFYFENSAKDLMVRIKKETNIKNVRLKKLSANNFRVFLGPYDNLNSLKNEFNAINSLQFENIEILKN